MRTSGRGRRLRAVVLAAAAGVALSAAGCGDDEPTDLPSASQAPSASADPKAAVETAYLGFQGAIEKIAASGDPNPAQLQPYATDAWAQKTAENLSILFDQGYRMVGERDIDVQTVTVTGDTAVVRACVDAREWVTVKEGKQPSPGQTGQPPAAVRAELAQQSGEWLVSGSKDDGTC